jgi:hypothetical protein
VQFIYQDERLKLVPWVGVASEFEYAGNDIDEWDDNDFIQYGVVPILKLNEAWTLKGYFRYSDDQREWDENSALVSWDAENVLTGTSGKVYEILPVINGNTPHSDRSGFDASVHVDGGIGNVGLAAEVSYKEADFQGAPTGDDGIGAYFQAAFGGIEAFTPIVLAGVTQGGFVADRNFGFVMVGGNQPTTVVNVGNPYGDLMFAALVMQHNISDRLSVQGNLLFAQYDYDDGPTMIVDDAIEVSGVFAYAMSESTSLTYKLGTLLPGYDDDDMVDDPFFGHSLQLEVEF